MKTKKNDFILIGIMLLIALGFFLGYRLIFANGSGGMVKISVDGKEYANLSIQDAGRYIIRSEQPVLKLSDKDEPTIYNSSNYNMLEIKDGKAFMSEATCPDLLCVHQKSISAKGEQIVCLPNKVIVEISDGEKSEVDSIAN